MTIPARNAAPRSDGAPPFEAALARSIKRIGRSKGVPRSELDDLVHIVWIEVDRSWARIGAMPQAARRKYVFGIARNVACDWFKRERAADVELVTFEAAASTRTVPSHEASVEQQEIARKLRAAAEGRDPQGAGWVERHVAHDESLKQIAADDRVPYTTVRKRVSRLLAWLKEHAGTLTLLLMLMFCALRWYLDSRPRPRRDEATPPPAPQPTTPLQRAREVRRQALLQCDTQQWQPCLDGLDAAGRLDPAGDQAPEVQKARARAQAALASAPASAPAPDEKPPVAAGHGLPPK